jgi:hypothetical protein
VPGGLGVPLAIREASQNLEKQEVESMCLVGCTTDGRFQKLRVTWKREVESVCLVGCTTDGIFQKLPKHVLISRRDTEAGSQWVAVSGVSCSLSKGKTLAILQKDRLEDRELQQV